MKMARRAEVFDVKAFSVRLGGQDYVRCAEIDPTSQLVAVHVFQRRDQLGPEHPKYVIQFLHDPPEKHRKTLELAQQLGERCRFIIKIECIELRPPDRMLQILMPCFGNRDLHQLIDEQSTFTFENSLPLIFAICSTVKFVHEQELCHPNLAPANVLVFKDTGIYRGRLIGFSKLAPVGTRCDGRLALKEIAVLDLGRIFWRMFNGERPAELVEVIYGMIDEKSSNRYSIVKALEDPVFARWS
jgi:serine/threonine protein kinase